MNGVCPSETCPYAPVCYQDTHHLYWPRTAYSTKTERQFRQLPENKEELCRQEHDQRHLLPPPEKPSREAMLQAIANVSIRSAHG